MYKNHTIEKNVKNKLWEGYSIKFKYVKKLIFRPKQQNRRSSLITRNRDSKTEKGEIIKKRKITKKVISVTESNSDDSDYENNIPLMHIRDGLKGLKGEIIKKRKITKKVISVTESDSDDSDYENNIPLMHIRDGLKGFCDSSPIGQRTRSRVLRCEKGREEWDLNDYERWGSKEPKEFKIVSNYTQLGVTPLSPHANSKKISIFCKTNVKKTKLDKKNWIKSSTPKRTSMPKSRV